MLTFIFWQQNFIAVVAEEKDWVKRLSHAIRNAAVSIRERETIKTPTSMFLPYKPSPPHTQRGRSSLDLNMSDQLQPYASDSTR